MAEYTRSIFIVLIILFGEYTEKVFLLNVYFEPNKNIVNKKNIGVPEPFMPRKTPCKARPTLCPLDTIMKALSSLPL